MHKIDHLSLIGKRVCIIGLQGSGKSELAKYLIRRYNSSFIIDPMDEYGFVDKDKQNVRFVPPSDVSIHAPAWGATYQYNLFVLHSPFQSTPPRGGRRLCHRIKICSLVFQSTPPRGGRPIAKIVTDEVVEFQSTPPRGGRHGGGGVYSTG